MAVRLTPEPGQPIPNKRVTPDDWDPKQEWFEIPVYLDPKARPDALAAATKTVVEGGKPREEVDNDTYFRIFLGGQIKGWRLLDERGDEIPFTPENVARLPWGIRGWLHDTVFEGDGRIPTRHILTKADDGTLLDFRGQAQGVDAGPAPGGDDPQ